MEAEYSNPVMTNSNKVPREKVKHTLHLLVVCVALLVVAIEKSCRLYISYIVCDVFISKVKIYIVPFGIIMLTLIIHFVATEKVNICWCFYFSRTRKLY